MSPPGPIPHDFRPLTPGGSKSQKSRPRPNAMRGRFALWALCFGMYFVGDRVPPERSRSRFLPREIWTLKDENLKFRSNVASIHFISMPHYFNDVYLQAHIFFMCIGANPLPLRPNQGPQIGLHLGRVPLRITLIHAVIFVSCMSMSTSMKALIDTLNPSSTIRIFRVPSPIMGHILLCLPQYFVKLFLCMIIYHLYIICGHRINQ